MICRNLHGLRLAGWFDTRGAILVAHRRTRPPEAVPAGRRPRRSRPTGIPIVFDLEIGHVHPTCPWSTGRWPR